MTAFTEPFTLVLVEDDEGHARLISRNLQRTGVRNPIVRLKNGEEALNWLFGAQGQPCVVILDLNLPDIDGFEILHRLKTDVRTRDMPVIVLTTTDHPNDIERCFALGCDGFLTKPVGHDAFAAHLDKLGLALSVVPVSPLRDRS